MLLGLLAVAVPLVLHAWLRHNAPVVSLDAVMALVLHGQGTARRLRAVHVALLVVRALVVAGAAVMFARPYREVPATAGAGERPLAVAVVLDDSLSMRLASEGGTAWERARDVSLRALRELPAESTACVVRASRPVVMVPEAGGGWEPEQAARYVEGLSAGRGATDLPAAVRAALSRVRASPQRDRRVVVVSDFLQHATAGFPSAPEQAGVDVVLVDVSQASSARNRAVVDVTASPAPDLSPGRIRVRVTVRNGTPDPMDEILSVRAGAAAAARRVECPPRDVCAAEFRMEVDEGVRVGEARLPPDDLPDDDVRYFSLEPRDRSAVLLVEGLSTGRESDRASFFLSWALSLHDGDDPGLAVTTVPAGELSPLHLAAVGTVGLLDPGPLAPDRARALTDFVASGGGLLVAAGPDTDLESWRTTLAPLLPAPARAVARLDAAEGAPGRRIERVDPAHPATAGLSGLLGEARVDRVLVLEDGWAADATVLASLEGGMPVLAARRLGRGTVLAWLSGLDRRWSDLPLRPAFAPLARQAFAWLRQAGGARPAGAVRVGEARWVEVPADADGVRVVPPSGAAVTMPRSGAFEGTVLPGVYRVEPLRAGRPDAARADAFVVNPDPAESDLVRGPGAPEVLAGGRTRSSDDGVPAPFQRTPLAGHVLAGILALLLAEAWLRGKA
jgi:hypothetical protein